MVRKNPVGGDAPGGTHGRRALPRRPLVGYLEGYYGRLLQPHERLALLETLHDNAMSAWWYAPKDDALHRMHWRTPYGAAWRRAFRDFAARAAERRIELLAGVAPGLDFDFAMVRGGADFVALRDKTSRLLDDGASVPTLLFDDIDDDFATRAGDFASEGVAHATLANELGAALGTALVVVPRVYANELHAGSADYLPDFAATLDPAHAISLCGSDVVVHRVDERDCRRHLGGGGHRILVWDNLYANDYCPRRLFLGPWTGRESISDVLINPTGLPVTDALLLSLVGAERERQARYPDTGNERGAATPEQVWRDVLHAHGVPASFLVVADCFDHPVVNAAVNALDPLPALDEALAALDELTWRWKSPLAREWFPWLMSLRHDLLLAADRLPIDRINKTQSAALARRLSSGGIR